MTTEEKDPNYKIPRPKFTFNIWSDERTRRSKIYDKFFRSIFISPNVPSLYNEQRSKDTRPTHIPNNVENGQQIPTHHTAPVDGPIVEYATVDKQMKKYENNKMWFFLIIPLICLVAGGIAVLVCYLVMPCWFDDSKTCP